MKNEQDIKEAIQAFKANIRAYGSVKEVKTIESSMNDIIKVLEWVLE